MDSADRWCAAPTLGQQADKAGPQRARHLWARGWHGHGASRRARLAAAPRSGAPHWGKPRCGQGSRKATRQTRCEGVWGGRRQGAANLNCSCCGATGARLRAPGPPNARGPCTGATRQLDAYCTPAARHSSNYGLSAGHRPDQRRPCAAIEPPAAVKRGVRAQRAMVSGCLGACAA